MRLCPAGHSALGNGARRCGLDPNRGRGDTTSLIHRPGSRRGLALLAPVPAMSRGTLSHQTQKASAVAEKQPQPSSLDSQMRS